MALNARLDGFFEGRKRFLARPLVPPINDGFASLANVQAFLPVLRLLGELVVEPASESGAFSV